MKNYVFLFLCLSSLLSACHGHKMHQVKFYKELDKGSAKDEGYHANEAQRLLDYNGKNKEVNQKHAKETQKKLNEDLGQLNRPNNYNAKVQKPKKKRFTFYM